MVYRRKRKQRHLPPLMNKSGRYVLKKFNRVKKVNQIKGRKKFARVAQRAYCMVTAINNVFGKEVIKVDEVIKAAKNLNETNKSTAFGNEAGFFHYTTIKVCLNRVGFDISKCKGIVHTHTTMSEIKEGKYIVLGYSDATNVHAIAIDGDNSLCICDTESGYHPLSEYAIIKSLPYGVLTCFKISLK